MQGFLRLFPINCVIFPHEEINLHIFEPRYLQLIGECEDKNEDFGIPFYQSELRPYGTKVRLKAIRKRYPDGKLDLTVVGIDPFEILKFESKVESKLYPGGIIKTRHMDFEAEDTQKEMLLGLLETFFQLLGMRPKENIDVEQSLSFQIGHKVGLSLDQELELLLTESESDRQEFMIHHLQYMIDSMEQAQSARKRIQLNGFFRSFDPLDF